MQEQTKYLDFREELFNGFLMGFMFQTTLAKIIANHCKQHSNTKFVQLSAAAVGVADVRNTIKAAKTDQTMFRRKTILFLDEIHRFNKLQQVRLVLYQKSFFLNVLDSV